MERQLEGTHQPDTREGNMTETIRRLIGIGGIWCWLAMAGGVAFAGSSGGNWALVDQEEGQSDFYYDKGAVTRTDGLLNIRAKVVYGPEGKAEALELLGNAKLYGSLAATQYRYDINCATGQSRLAGVSHRDGADKVLREFDLTGKTSWEEIPVGSRLEMVSEAECPPPAQ
jgi:hypothetical protein